MFVSLTASTMFWLALQVMGMANQRHAVLLKVWACRWWEEEGGARLGVS